MFYNTGISTYIWILDNDKPEERRGKVQLIDGTSFFSKMRKGLGSKRKEIGAAERAVSSTSTRRTTTRLRKMPSSPRCC